MRCLRCSSSDWRLCREWLSPIVNNEPIEINMVLFKCRGCGQTSADEAMMDSLIKECLKQVKKNIYLKI